MKTLTILTTAIVSLSLFAAVGSSEEKKAVYGKPDYGLSRVGKLVTACSERRKPIKNLFQNRMPANGSRKEAAVLVGSR